MKNHPLAQRLLSWYQNQKRDLPWRWSKEPYPVWISEVILQQTRVDQGVPYFLAFMENFPTVNDLANAREEQVLKIWEGLGYYSRARNLHAGAKYISEECQGVFPSSYESLLKVKGVGPYTAAAISSICFGKPNPVLDGNVFRVASRQFGIFEDIAKPASRKVFISLLEKIIASDNPGDFNQSIMDLGATVCTPQNPDCFNCPISVSCFALKHKKQSELPVKKKKIKVKDRYFHYMVLEHAGHFAVKKRDSGDVWQGLYDFFLEELPDKECSPSFLKPNKKQITYHSSRAYRHILSHQRIHAVFHHLETASEKIFKKIAADHQLDTFSWTDIVALPKPRLIVNYLNEYDF